MELYENKTFKYKTLEYTKNDADFTLQIANEVIKRYHQIEQIEEPKQQEAPLISSARKTWGDLETKRMVDFDKPFLAPFSYNYFDPVTGDNNSVFIDDSTKPSLIKGKNIEKLSEKYYKQLPIL